jgi:aminoglycoside phosphotransferase family enzyme
MSDPADEGEDARCIISIQRQVQVALVFSNPGRELERTGGSGDMVMVMGAGLLLVPEEFSNQHVAATQSAAGISELEHLSRSYHGLEIQHERSGTTIIVEGHGELRLETFLKNIEIPIN